MCKYGNCNDSINIEGRGRIQNGGKISKIKIEKWILGFHANWFLIKLNSTVSKKRICFILGKK